LFEELLKMQKKMKK